MTKASIEAYAGSPWVERIKPADVLSSWNRERSIVVKQTPAVIVSRPDQKEMNLGEKSYFLPTRHFTDGSSVLRDQALDQIEPGTQAAVIVANLQTEGDLINVVGAAQDLRQGGVDKMMLVTSRLCGQRQDRIFTDHDTGEMVRDTVTSFNVLRILAQARDLSARKLIDRLVILEAHSSHLFQQASILGLPALGLSAYRFMAQKAGLYGQVDETFGILGPDKGRHTTAHLLARELGLKVFSFQKERDRTTGKLELVKPEKTLKRLKQAGIRRGIMFDDEIQSGATTDLIVSAAGLEEITILAAHANFSEATNGNLQNPAIKKVIVTNAMVPMVEQDKLKSGNKFVVIDIWPDLIAASLRLWDQDPRTGLTEGLVLDPWFS